MTRALRAIAMFALCAACAAPARAQSETQADGSAPSQPLELPLLGGFITESSIVYPLRLGEWEARGEHRYEPAEAGVSVRYQHRRHQDRWADVYFYPSGPVDAQRLRAETEGTLKGILAHGDYADVEAADVHDLAWAVAGRRVPAQSVALSLRRDGVEYSSALVMLARDLYFIKGRFSATAEALAPERVRHQLETLMKQLVRSTSLASSGACWSADPAAAVEGCRAPDEVAPDVPPTHREMRFEYRAPDASRDGPVPRLRARRTGTG